MASTLIHQHFSCSKMNNQARLQAISAGINAATTALLRAGWVHRTIGAGHGEIGNADTLHVLYNPNLGADGHQHTSQATASMMLDFDREPRTYANECQSITETIFYLVAGRCFMTIPQVVTKGQYLSIDFSMGCLTSDPLVDVSTPADVAVETSASPMACDPDEESAPLVATYDALTCVVCMTAGRTHAGSACGHFCLCATCVAAVGGRCPLCNTSGAFIRIFMS